MIFYSDSSEKKAGRFNSENAPAVEKYLEHYANFLVLQDIANKHYAPYEMRMQAEREMAICERKLLFWTRHANFVQEKASDGANKLLREIREA